MFVELGDCVVIGSGTNIKHEGVLWLDVLADALEEPLVTVDLTIVSLFEGKDEVDSSSVQRLLFKAEVPGACLEQVEAVLLDLLFWDTFHQLLHGLHFPFAGSLILGHVTIILKIFNVKELIFGGKLFELFSDLLVTITNQDNDQILLAHVNILVHIHGVVVLDDTLQGDLQL